MDKQGGMLEKDKFGFFFWLQWILWFAGAWTASALVWTFLFKALFGEIKQTEIVLVWAIAVFGSWFIFLTPFMRKKEQIWKRLNTDQEKGVDLWLNAVSTFIGLLVLTGFVWTWNYRANLMQSGRTGIDPLWLKSVLGTWLILVLPYLVWMYRRADTIFKEAVIRQTQSGPSFRTVFVERSKRLLAKPLADKIKQTESTLPEGHIVNLILKEDQKIPHVFIYHGEEILGVYDRVEMGFNTADVVNVEKVESSALPPYEESRWLRLDGRA